MLRVYGTVLVFLSYCFMLALSILLVMSHSHCVNFVLIPEILLFGVPHPLDFPGTVGRPTG